MKAIVCTKYGPPEVLRPAEVPTPVPLNNEVLVRIHATTCHIGDVRVRHAEYICLPEDARDIRKGLVVHKPTAMSFAEAAAGLATGGLTALSMLKRADVRPGRRVLVYGASGSVGMYAVFDAVGKLPAVPARRLTAPSGLRLSVAKHAGSVGKMTTADLQFLTGLVDARELHTFIDREYPLDRIVEAHTYVQQGHKRGHVVINVSPAS